MILNIILQILYYLLIIGMYVLAFILFMQGEANYTVSLVLIIVATSLMLYKNIILKLIKGKAKKVDSKNTSSEVERQTMETEEPKTEVEEGNGTIS